MAHSEIGRRLIAASVVSAATATAVIVIEILAASLIEQPSTFAHLLVFMFAMGWVVALVFGLFVGIPIAIAAAGFLLWLEHYYPWASHQAAWVWWGALVAFASAALLRESLELPPSELWSSLGLAMAGAAGALAFRRMLCA